MKVYKGTNKDMQCTPNGKVFQYEIGKTYEKPEAKLCQHGFHACEAPLDVLHYYPPADGSRYFEAELEDVSPERRKEDTKVCGKKITIGAEIGIPGLAKAHVQWVKETCEKATEQNASGESGNAAASGWRGNAAASGWSGNAAASGESGNAAASGWSGNAAASGERGVACSSGKYGSSEANGEQTIAVAWGAESKARGALGSWIVCSEYDEAGKKIICAKMGLIDGETLKADTWYTLKNGEFVEASE